MNEFLPEEFDPWAENYDQDVAAEAGFPFSGYADLLKSILQTAQPQPNEKSWIWVVVLESGGCLLPFGCQNLWHHFSASMLAKASSKYPTIPFALADVRESASSEFPEHLRCDRLCLCFSPLSNRGKNQQLLRFKDNHLQPGGRILIGDLSSPARQLCSKLPVITLIPGMRNIIGFWIVHRNDGKGRLSVQPPISFCAGMLWLAL